MAEFDDPLCSYLLIGDDNDDDPWTTDVTSNNFFAKLEPRQETNSVVAVSDSKLLVKSPCKSDLSSNNVGQISLNIAKEEVDSPRPLSESQNDVKSVEKNTISHRVHSPRKTDLSSDIVSQTHFSLKVTKEKVDNPCLLSESQNDAKSGKKHSISQYAYNYTRELSQNIPKFPTCTKRKPKNKEQEILELERDIRELEKANYVIADVELSGHVDCAESSVSTCKKPTSRSRKKLPPCDLSCIDDVVNEISCSVFEPTVVSESSGNVDEIVEDKIDTSDSESDIFNISFELSDSESFISVGTETYLSTQTNDCESNTWTHSVTDPTSQTCIETSNVEDTMVRVNQDESVSAVQELAIPQMVHYATSCDSGLHGNATGENVVTPDDVPNNDILDKVKDNTAPIITDAHHRSLEYAAVSEQAQRNTEALQEVSGHSTVFQVVIGSVAVSKEATRSIDARGSYISSVSMSSQISEQNQVLSSDLTRYRIQDGDSGLNYSNAYVNMNNRDGSVDVAPVSSEPSKELPVINIVPRALTEQRDVLTQAYVSVDSPLNLQTHSEYNELNSNGRQDRGELNKLNSDDQQNHGRLYEWNIDDQQNHGEVIKLNSNDQQDPNKLNEVNSYDQRGHSELKKLNSNDQQDHGGLHRINSSDHNGNSPALNLYGAWDTSLFNSPKAPIGPFISNQSVTNNSNINDRVNGVTHSVNNNTNSGAVDDFGDSEESDASTDDSDDESDLADTSQEKLAFLAAVSLSSPAKTTGRSPIAAQSAIRNVSKDFLTTSITDSSQTEELTRKSQIDVMNCIENYSRYCIENNTFDEQFAHPVHEKENYESLEISSVADRPAQQQNVSTVPQLSCNNTYNDLNNISPPPLSPATMSSYGTANASMPLLRSFSPQNSVTTASMPLIPSFSTQNPATHLNQNDKLDKSDILGSSKNVQFLMKGKLGREIFYPERQCQCTYGHQIICGHCVFCPLRHRDRKVAHGPYLQFHRNNMLCNDTLRPQGQNVCCGNTVQSTMSAPVANNVPSQLAINQANNFCGQNIVVTQSVINQQNIVATQPGINQANHLIISTKNHPSQLQYSGIPENRQVQNTVTNVAATRSLPLNSQVSDNSDKTLVSDEDKSLPSFSAFLFPPKETIVIKESFDKLNLLKSSEVKEAPCPVRDSPKKRRVIPVHDSRKSSPFKGLCEKQSKGKVVKNFDKPLLNMTPIKKVKGSFKIRLKSPKEKVTRAKKTIVKAKKVKNEKVAPKKKVVSNSKSQARKGRTDTRKCSEVPKQGKLKQERNKKRKNDNELENEIAAKRKKTHDNAKESEKIEKVKPKRNAKSIEMVANKLRKSLRSHEKGEEEDKSPHVQDTGEQTKLRHRSTVDTSILNSPLWKNELHNLSFFKESLIKYHSSKGSAADSNANLKSTAKTNVKCFVGKISVCSSNDDDSCVLQKLNNTEQLKEWLLPVLFASFSTQIIDVKTVDYFTTMFLNVVSDKLPLKIEVCKNHVLNWGSKTVATCLFCKCYMAMLELDSDITKRHAFQISELKFSSTSLVSNFIKAFMSRSGQSVKNLTATEILDRYICNKCLLSLQSCNVCENALTPGNRLFLNWLKRSFVQKQLKPYPGPMGKKLAFLNGKIKLEKNFTGELKSYSVICETCTSSYMFQWH